MFAASYCHFWVLCVAFFIPLIHSVVIGDEEFKYRPKCLKLFAATELLDKEWVWCTTDCSHIIAHHRDFNTANDIARDVRPDLETEEQEYIILYVDHEGTGIFPVSFDDLRLRNYALEEFNIEFDDPVGGGLTFWTEIRFAGEKKVRKMKIDTGAAISRICETKNPPKSCSYISDVGLDGILCFPLLVDLFLPFQEQHPQMFSSFRCSSANFMEKTLLI